MEFEPHHGDEFDFRGQAAAEQLDAPETLDLTILDAQEDLVPEQRFVGVRVFRCRPARCQMRPIIILFSCAGFSGSRQMERYQRQGTFRRSRLSYPIEGVGREPSRLPASWYRQGGTLDMAVANIEEHRWTRRDYERLVAKGFFPVGKRVELVEGVIYDMTPQRSLHATAFRLAQEALRTASPAARYEDSRPAPPCPE